MKFRHFLAIATLTTGITTLQFAILGASPAMVVCGLLLMGAAFEVV